jgi:hypothetical protein
LEGYFAESSGEGGEEFLGKVGCSEHPSALERVRREREGGGGGRILGCRIRLSLEGIGS